MKRKYEWAIIIVLPMLLIGVAMTGCLSSQNTGTGGIVVSNVKVSDWNSGNEFIKPQDGYKFVRCTFNLTNDGSTEASVNPFYFTLYTTDGQGYSWDAMVNQSMPTVLKPGASADCALGFSIPTNATPKQLDFKGL